MKRLFTALMLMMLLSMSIVPVASADHTDKGCPDHFVLHDIAEHDQHHQGHHHHVGSDADRNGDGHICVKPLPNGKHLHIDNNVPIK